MMPLTSSSSPITSGVLTASSDGRIISRWAPTVAMLTQVA
jgi:hypothetical protein